MSPLSRAEVLQRRDARQLALLAAAAELGAERGLASLTVGAVAQKAGMARSTVYSYFASSADLIADVLVDELHGMAETVAVSVADAQSPAEAVHLWVNSALSYVTDGRHALVRSAATVGLPATRRAEITALHRELLAPLVQALAQLGQRDLARIGQQVSAVIEVCVRRIESGAAADCEVAAAEQFILRGLGLR